MFAPHEVSSRRPAARLLIILGLLFLSVGLRDGAAQRGGPGSNLTPEQREKAWKIQAKTVARDLKLDAATEQKLTAAYLKSRERYQKATAEKFQGGAADRSQLAADILAIRENERKRLGRSVSEFLNADQTQRVEKTLGTLDIFWDLFAHELGSLEMPEGARNQAEALLMETAVKFAPERDRALKAGDMSLIARGMAPLKDSLDQKLESVLPGKAYKSWLEKTNAPRGKG